MERIHAARMAYVLFAWGIVVALLAQVSLIGLWLFSGQPTLAIHKEFGHLIFLMVFALLILAFVGRLPSHATCDRRVVRHHCVSDRGLCAATGLTAARLPHGPPARDLRPRGVPCSERDLPRAGPCRAGNLPLDGRRIPSELSASDTRGARTYALSWYNSSQMPLGSFTKPTTYFG